MQIEPLPCKNFTSPPPPNVGPLKYGALRGRPLCPPLRLLLHLAILLHLWNLEDTLRICHATIGFYGILSILEQP